MKPENTYQITKTIDTSEASIFQVPSSKLSRIVYGMVVSDTSGGTNYIDFKIYKSDGTTLVSTTRINFSPNETGMIFDINSPIFNIPEGYHLKAIAGAASVMVHISYYDIGK